MHLLQHELEHVRQYRELGFIGFLLRYLTDYLRLRCRGFGHDAAYRRIPTEVQAEWRTRRRLGVGVVASAAPAPDGRTSKMLKTLEEPAPIR